MYKIALRNGSPVSAGYMMEVKGNSATGGDVRENEVVCIVDGHLEYSPAGLNNGCPDAIISRINSWATTETGFTYPDNATVMLLTPDMFLEAPVRGTDAQIQALKAGAYIRFSADSVIADGVSEFCQVIDTQGAKTAGDKIIVRFVKKEATTE